MKIDLHNVLCSQFIFAEGANIKVLSTHKAASTIQWIAHRQKNKCRHYKCTSVILWLLLPLCTLGPNKVNFPLAPFVVQKSGTNAMGSDLLDVYIQIQSGSTNVPPISV